MTAPIHRRRDASRVKKELLSVLGPSKSGEYWMTLKSFLLGALDRQKLDSTARNLLGSLHMDLHNELLLTILRNSQPQIQPPYSDSITAALRTAKLSLRPPADAPSKQKLKKTLSRMILDGEQRKSLAQFGSLNKHIPLDLLEHNKYKRSYGDALNSSFLSSMPDSSRNELRRTCFLPVPSEQKALPDLNVLRAQMSGISREAGLGGKISDECVLYLSRSMETHLKNILSDCFRSRPAEAQDGLSLLLTHASFKSRVIGRNK